MIFCSLRSSLSSCCRQCYHWDQALPTGIRHVFLQPFGPRTFHAGIFLHILRQHCVLSPLLKLACWHFRARMQKNWQAHLSPPLLSVLHTSLQSAIQRFPGEPSPASAAVARKRSTEMRSIATFIVDTVSAHGQGGSTGSDACSSRAASCPKGRVDAQD